VVGIRAGVHRVEGRERGGAVVVLPFTPLDGDSTSAYLTEGLTEDLTTALGSVDGLRVLATESVLPLRQRRLDARTIGRELGVDAVLDGSIRTEGDRARITVRLVNVADGFQLWSGRFDRTTSNALSVQEEIADSIVAALRGRLPGVVGSPRPRVPVDAETYDLFARGRYFENRSGEKNLRKAMSYYEQALARDSSFAPAYAGLADVYLTLSNWGMTYGETAPRARAFAERALQLDSTTGAAHETLAQLLRYDWRWSEAEREYHQALAANPNDVRALHALSHLYLSTGQLDSSLVVSRRALALDPLNPRIGMHLCVHFITARQYDDALTACRRGLELDPAFPDSHAKLAWLYHYRGRDDTALTEIDQEIALSGRNPEYEMLRALIHASAGRAEVAREILKEVDRRTPAARMPFATGAAVDLRLNDRAHALQRLEDAYALHSVDMEALATEQEFDPIRDEPRFVELLRRVGVRSWSPKAASSGDARSKREMSLPD
jgi:TolB-like protein/Tfp pilus assembly protein PilF